MNGCDAVRESLMDVARGAPCENALREHLENCDGCRRRLANERMLSVGLAAMASHDVPPATVRNAVMAEFRRTNKVVPIRRPFIRWVAMAAAAAAILLAVWVTMRQPAKSVVAVTPRVEAPAPVLAPIPGAPVGIAQATRPAKRRRAVKVSPPPIEAPAAESTAESAPEVATDFFEIPYAEPLRPEERVDVFRIQMPRANMTMFGLPVTGGRLDSRVTADVLVGEDGVMRAVRFVR